MLKKKIKTNKYNCLVKKKNDLEWLVGETLTRETVAVSIMIKYVIHVQKRFLTIIFYTLDGASEFIIIIAATKKRHCSRCSKLLETQHLIKYSSAQLFSLSARRYITLGKL